MFSLRLLAMAQKCRNNASWSIHHVLIPHTASGLRSYIVMALGLDSSIPQNMTELFVHIWPTGSTSMSNNNLTSHPNVNVFNDDMNICSMVCFDVRLNFDPFNKVIVAIFSSNIYT